MPLAPTEARLQPDPLGGLDDVSLGDAVRRARRDRRLSLQTVADGVGISTGLLSQIERGISSPSVRNLRAICEVIGIPFMSLFEAAPSADRENGLIVRSGHRRTVDFGDRGMVKSFLTAHDEGSLQVMEIVIEPGGGSGDESYSHEGEECGVVLCGEAELFVDEDSYRLREGDSFHFESKRPHRFRNIGQDICKIMWVTTPPVW
ncbi:helix-turn-helix domain-containing protein [Thioclava atlantica]|uniref:XRE family-like protein n=1 Tax=Thioclava atlantica TaxID=1317124 RepID=A0A085TSA6_9RHOB|nr:XRE family transcriptional regulator [Thioclava atlantica]KFE33603.1 XRE family-like protein [Thioclava atlantica]